MQRIKIGQIGIGHNHGNAKMLAVRKFPELFEVIGFAEENENWIKERGALPAYRGLQRYGVDELIEKCDAILVETDVWNLTEISKKCVEAGKHIHMDKPASGTLPEYEELLSLAQAKELVVQLGYMYRYNPAVQECMKSIQSGELGEIYSINAEMSTCHPVEYRSWLKNFKGGIMYKMTLWTNVEGFERDPRFMYYPIPFELLQAKLEMSKKYVEKSIMFEFSHFLSPQSIYPSAQNLYNLYVDFYSKNK